jgi:hypothetical protein
MHRSKHFIWIALTAAFALLTVGCNTTVPTSETPGKQAAPTNVDRSTSK